MDLRLYEASLWGSSDSEDSPPRTPDHARSPRPTSRTPRSPRVDHALSPRPTSRTPTSPTCEVVEILAHAQKNAEQREKVAGLTQQLSKNLAEMPSSQGVAWLRDELEATQLEAGRQVAELQQQLDAATRQASRVSELEQKLSEALSENERLRQEQAAQHADLTNARAELANVQTSVDQIQLGQLQREVLALRQEARSWEATAHQAATSHRTNLLLNQSQLLSGANVRSVQDHMLTRAANEPRYHAVHLQNATAGGRGGRRSVEAVDVDERDSFWHAAPFAYGALDTAARAQNSNTAGAAPTKDAVRSGVHPDDASLIASMLGSGRVERRQAFADTVGATPRNLERDRIMSEYRSSADYGGYV